MAQKSQQHKEQASAATTDAAPSAQPNPSPAKANPEELGRIVQLFKEMPAHFKDEIRKELGASGIVREKRRRRSTNEGAASLVHTVGDVLHPPGHVAKPPEWVIEKGEHFRATWEKQWDLGRPYITESNMAYEYDGDPGADGVVGELGVAG